MDAVFVYQVICIVFSGVFGLVIGSFLNVCIYRIPEGRTVVKGHSMCMTCGHNLAAADLVPVFSWICLRGKCRYCGAPVSSRYARIEGLTCAVFLILAWERRGAFFLPGDSLGEIAPMISLLILFTLSCVMIVAMMIQKDRGSVSYRFSAVIAAFLVIRISLSATLPGLLPDGSWKASAGGFLSALGLTVLAALISGDGPRRYFSSDNRAHRSMDLLYITVCAAIGIPAAIPCLAAYTIVRMLKKSVPAEYLGITVAAAAFIGIVVFPGFVF